jgi:hypothetical protein
MNFLKNFYDKIGIGSIGIGVDGLLLHTDASEWLDKFLPYFIAITAKILLLILGFYLIKLYNQSRQKELDDFDVTTALAKREATVKKIKRYHWFVLILLVYLSVAMNWGNEPGSGGGIALFLIIAWLAIIWPIIHFKGKAYVDAKKITDVNALKDRQLLIAHLIDLSKLQYKKAMNIMLTFLLVGPIVSAIFPSFIGETESGPAFGSALVFIGFITFLLWITGLFKKRKINKIKQYYEANPNAKIWASEESENTLTLMIDDKKIEVGTIFLPITLESCCSIINQLNEGDLDFETAQTSDAQSVNEQVDESLTLNDTINSEVSKAQAATSPELLPHLKYKPSGKGSIGLFLLVSIVLLPLLAVLPFAYAYLIWYIPIPYVLAIVALVFGIALGYSFNWLVRLVKSRNAKWVAYITLVLANVLHYVGWCVWLDLFLNSSQTISIDHPKVPFSSITPSVTDWYQLRDLILNPSYVFSTVFDLARTGYYTIFSWQPTGFWLYLFWIIEACLVLFFAVVLPMAETKKPFSEKLNKWYPNKVYTIGFLHDINQFVQALNAQDFTALSSLQSTHADQDHALLTLYYLPNEEAFISISNQDRKVNEKGKFETKSTEIVEYYKITASQAEQLQKQLV